MKGGTVPYQPKSQYIGSRKAFFVFFRAWDVLDDDEDPEK